MEEPKFRKFYIDWWKIRRSTIAWLVVLLVAVPSILGLSYWAIRNDWFAQTAAADIPQNAARIISFEGDVRITRASTRETIVVTKETYVAAGDTIQTQGDGKATVQMLDGSVYTVRANSTVVVRDNSSIFGGTNIRVSLDDGQLNVRTDQQPENTKNVVEMMDSETQVRPQTDASFNADAGTNGGEIRISRGSVETTIGGQQTTINANEYAAVNNGRLSGKEGLLAAPRQLTPENSAQVIDAAGQGITASFTWADDGSAPVGGYYLQIARSPYFASDSILVDRGSITTRDFRLAGMSPGVYYWRLKVTSRSGQTSEWSEPWRFSIVRRGPAGDIDVDDWRTENVGGSVYIVSGRTSPGLRIKALGREVFSAGDGTFRLQVATPQPEVAVELSDDRGNRAGFVVSLRGGKLLRRF